MPQYLNDGVKKVTPRSKDFWCEKALVGRERASTYTNTGLSQKYRWPHHTGVCKQRNKVCPDTSLMAT